jgi:hypothetical protein
MGAPPYAATQKHPRLNQGRRPFTKIIERTRMARVIGDARKQIDTHRPDERAACPARLDRAHASAHAANRRRGNATPALEKTDTQDGSGPDRESADHAAQLAAKAAAGPEGLMRLQLRQAKLPDLASGIDFSIESAKIGQSVHRQAVLVLFAIDVYFHQMPGQPLTRALRLGTVCKRAVYAQRDRRGEVSSDCLGKSFEPLRLGKACCPKSFLKKCGIACWNFRCKAEEIRSCISWSQADLFIGAIQPAVKREPGERTTDVSSASSLY